MFFGEPPKTTGQRPVLPRRRVSLVGIAGDTPAATVGVVVSVSIGIIHAS